MDNRYLLIIVFILICLVNLFFIASNSDEIGSASVIAGEFIFELPKNFNILESTGDHVSLQNPDTNLNVNVYTNQNRIYDFNKTVSKINNETNVKILSNGSINVNNITVNAIYYTHYPENISANYSAFVFSKDNHVFQINMKNFNYKNDLNYTVEVLDVIVSSIRVNPKT